MTNEKNRTLFRIRLLISAFVFCLVVSGVTAFPLFWETGLLVRWFGGDTSLIGQRFPELASWLTFIHEGIAHNAERYPFMAYGTDWLAFAHIVIAVFFIGPLIDPVRNIWVIRAGIIACALIPVLAFVCGPIRGVPFYWRLFDSLFGVLGVVPLLFIHRWTIRLVQKEKS